MKGVWARRIVALIGGLHDLVSEPEEASALLQAIQATAAWALFILPKSHSLLQSEAVLACLHDACMQLCPAPSQANIVLATSRLPTWPCPDEQLMALEAISWVCNLHTRHAGLANLSFNSLLRAQGPFVPNRPPICDGAGSASSADHSIAGASPLTKASSAWLAWAADLDLAPRVSSHISQSRPAHPLSEEEQDQALTVLCQALDLDKTNMSYISPGQPFRLNLMQALADLRHRADRPLAGGNQPKRTLKQSLAYYQKRRRLDGSNRSQGASKQPSRCGPRA